MLLRSALAVLLVGMAAGHNWMNTPGRAQKVSFVKPCPARQNLEQKHVQINPGGTFPVEWAMGHEGTKGNWVLVRAEDEMKLKAWDDQLASRYFAAAPATEKFKSYFVDDKTVSNIDRKKQKGNCGVKAGTRVFSKEVDSRTAYNRPAHFEQFAKSGGYKFYEFTQAMDANCHSTTWAGYQNKDYPWIVAASGYTIAVGAAKSGSISLFKIPKNAPSGKYVLHWWWRKYVNCLDIDVVIGSKKVTDVWGSAMSEAPVKSGDGKHASFTAQTLVTSRIDHCQTHRQGYLGSNPDDPEQDLTGIKKQDRFTDDQRKQRFATGKKKEAEKLKEKAANLKEQEAAAKEIASYSKTKSGKQLRKDPKFKKMEADAKALRLRGTRIEFEMYQQIVIPFMGKLNRQDWGVWYPKCQIVKKGEDAAKACASMCKPSNGNRDADAGQRCDSINIVPWKLPATSAFAGKVNTMIPDWCMDDYKSMKIPDDARICYQLKEPAPTDGGRAMTVTTDPEDPAWHSTCLKVMRSQDRYFKAPNCGEPCKMKGGIEKEAEWRFGDRCISCDQMEANNKDISAKFVPEWSLAPSDKCVKCGQTNAPGADAAQGGDQGGVADASPVAYYCKHEAQKLSHYANCDICKGTPICCEVAKTAPVSSEIYGGSRCTDSKYGATSIGKCAGLKYPSACSAQRLVADDWAE